MARTRVIIGLSAVAITAREDGGPQVLVTGQGAGGILALPFGSFDPDGHRTFELAVRDFVSSQTGLALGWVEQLYTFGDKGREAPRAETGADMAPSDRVVSVGYLALVPQAAEPGSGLAGWSAWERFFPWEDRRPVARVRAQAALAAIQAGLELWVEAAPDAGGRAVRRARAATLFGLAGEPWRDDRVLERYELLYEAGLVPEAARDRARARGEPFDEVTGAARATGEPMASDHRRILATAIGRLRSKLRYRPVALDLMPETFTLSDLQLLAEGITGLPLHKSNFRRAVEKSGLVVPTGNLRTETGGRPAQLFTRAASGPIAPGGLQIPVLKG